MDVSRRNFLRGAAAGAAGSVLAGTVLAGGARADTQAEAAPVAPPLSYPFHGVHQAGVLTPGPADKQDFACYAAFDSTASSPAELAALLRTLTERARVLTTGGPAPDLGVGQPPADSAVLGVAVPADGLTITVSVGASLFDHRYGLAGRAPAKLTAMATFVDDAPEAAWMHGDLLVVVCAHHPDTVHHALRDLAKHTRGAMQLRWKLSAYGSPPRPSGTPRNLLGFKDGTANPTGRAAEALIWVDSAAEPAWARGGSYQVVRLIRMLVEFWDRVSLNEQETMIGRRRDSGAPLDGNGEFDVPHFEADPTGEVIATDSHIRLANPRTAATDNQRLVRRSYNYDLGVDANGNLQAGHVFTCYQQDVERQFATIQARLAGEPMVDYVQPFGGGYFFTLPGVVNSHDWYGRALLA